jgi:hypothetical protein
MSRSLIKPLSIQPPKELLPFLKNPPLVGDEKVEDYQSLIAALIPADMPNDAIAWLLLCTIGDTTWELRREKHVKGAMIELFLKEVVVDLLKATFEEPGSLESHRYRIFDAADEGKQWTLDGQARKQIVAKLAKRGYPLSDLMARAYTKGERQIDAIDRRIASIELRRNIGIRELERRSDRLARYVEKASSPIIDVEYSEAAE